MVARSYSLSRRAASIANNSDTYDPQVHTRSKIDHESGPSEVSIDALPAARKPDQPKLPETAVSSVDRRRGSHARSVKGAMKAGGVEGKDRIIGKGRTARSDTGSDHCKRSRYFC